VPKMGLSIILGVDYGRTPAAIFMQKENEQYRVFHEFLLSGVSTQTFARLLGREIQRRGWQDYMFECYGDPSGDDMKETSDEAPAQIMRAVGVPMKKALTNDPLIRVEAVAALMVKNTPHGPALQVSPTCQALIAGFRGGYNFKPVGGLKTGVYDSRPNKNRHSHAQDGLQYGVVSTGGWLPLIKGTKQSRVVTIERGGSPFGRLRSAQQANRGSFGSPR